MSDNPFDVFAADFKAAIPTTDDSNNGKQPEPINIMASPAAAPVPVMNAPAAPVMNQQPMQTPVMGAPGMSMNGGMGMYNQGAYGGYGMSNGMAQQPYGAPPPMGAGQMGGMPPAPMNGGMMGGQQGAMVPSAQQSNPYAMGGMGGMPQYGQQPPTMGQPPAGMAPPTMGQPSMGMVPPTMGQPPAPTPAEQAPVAPTPAEPAPVAPTPAEPAPVAPTSADPFAAPAPTGAPPAPSAAPPSADPFAPTVPAPAPVGQPQPFGAPPVPPPGPFGAPPVPPPAPVEPPQPFGAPQQMDPWAQPPAPTVPAPAANDAIVPVPNQPAGADPFGVFDQGPSQDAISVATPAPTKVYTSEQVAAAADDPWDSTPFGGSPTNASASAAPAPATNGGAGGLLGDGLVPVAENEQKSGELPPGGEWYDARIFTPTLGVMFFKPQELTDSLFLQTERSLVDALDDRPVVAFIVEGSSARAAGVELGHVLLKVNGIDVKNPKEASRLIKEGPRPLPLLFYVPDTSVVVAEGEHMVKYDTRETMAPNSAKDWKPKYVVIGGIIAQPWMMNMYRSKSEYDIAVIETQARRPVSVKVKQFSLQGARIQNDWQGPQMVKYKNKLHPWKYIVVLPISRNPIKISSPNLAQLKPVHEGIRRVLMAQQRYTPSPQRGDPYGGQGGGPPQQQYGQPTGGQYGGPPPQQYGQPTGGQYGGPPPQQYGQPTGGQYGQEQYNQAGGMGSVRRTTQY